MADAPGGGEGDDLKSLAMRKVGPLPLIAWAAIFIGVWYYIERKNSASSSSSTTAGSSAATAGSAAAQTDPLTGYPYGSSEDLAALAAQQEANASSGSSDSSGTTTSQTYTTNAAWGEAAINYLVGLGIDPTEANAAIEAYLNSQSLSTSQQADVNEAIQALGAPPQPPSPTTTGGGGIVNPPGSTV
jgi:hypothetical protein